MTVSKLRISSLAIQRGGPSQDRISTVGRPKFSSAAQVRLADGDSPLGVALKRITRAQPVHVPVWHEVVAGRAGEGTPIFGVSELNIES